MKVRLLTIQQKEDLVGMMFAPDSTFNPIEDANGNFVISNEEVSQCTNEEYAWVKDLPEIEYEPKKNEFEL